MMANRRATSPYKQVYGRLVKSALMSPQSASILVVALIGLGLQINVLGASPALWLVLGIAGILLYTLATLTDTNAVSHALNHLFLYEFNPADIKNLRARQRLQQALEYVETLQKLGARQGGALRLQIESTIGEIQAWLEQIYKIARRIDLYEDNTLINRDRARVPDELKMLRQRLENESDERVKAELAETIRLRETQLANLKALETNIKRADIQLDNTVAALGTIYAQVQLLDAKEVDGWRANRLREQIHDEVLSLKDTIDALDEVQSANLVSAASAQ
jgi:hypothetical protein